MGILIYTMTLLNYLIRCILHNTINLIVKHCRRVTFRNKGVQSEVTSLSKDILIRELILTYPKQ